MGWARANILFDRYSKTLPEPGSPMEILFILVWKMRQDIEFQKQRAVLQGLLAQKGSEDKIIMKVFDDLREAFFPFDRNQKFDESKRMRDFMAREISRGPLAITPLAEPERKQVSGRLAKGSKELAKRLSHRKEGNPIQEAYRRRRGAS